MDKSINVVCIILAHGLNHGLKDKQTQNNRFNGLKNYIMLHSFIKIWIHAIWATKIVGGK